jgi:uncharacterized membrane protein
MIATVLTEVFAVAAEVVTGLATLFGSLIATIFDGTDLTDFGSLVILVAAVPLSWNILSYIIGLFKSATKVKGR